MFIDDLLFPKRCASCDAWGSYLCDLCKQELRYFDFSLCPICDRPTNNGKTHDVCRSPLGLDGFIPIVQYREPASDLMKKIKYARVRDAAREAYSMFSLHWPDFAPSFDALIPVPMHPKKLRARGFNQAELFAHHLGKLNRTPILADALVKIRETASQASLKVDDRKQNLQQGFVCLHKKDVQNKKIGLVDDVATTRTTLSLACEVLKKAGAKEVWGVVLAHSF